MIVGDKVIVKYNGNYISLKDLKCPMIIYKLRENDTIAQIVPEDKYNHSAPLGYQEVFTRNLIGIHS